MNAAIKSGGYDVGGVIAKYTPRVHVSTGGVQYCGVDASARFDVFAHTRVPGPKTIIILPPPPVPIRFSLGRAIATNRTDTIVSSGPCSTMTCTLGNY